MCSICNKNINAIELSNTICNKCAKINSYSKQTCIETFEIDEEDLHDIKVYKNLEGNELYSKDDIIDLIIKTNTNELTKRTCQKTLNEKIRRDNLMKMLKEHKLEYIKNGICDAYIKYASPSLEDVLNILQEKRIEKRERMIVLLDKLKLLDIEYLDTVFAFKDYINNGGSIDEAIKEGNIEIFLMKETNYLELLKQHEREDAKEIALINYVSSGGNNETLLNVIKRTMTINFD